MSTNLPQRKLRIGLFGATGIVGQRIALRLVRHPWFELVAVAASQRSAGKLLREASLAGLGDELPEALAALEVEEAHGLARRGGFDLAISALDASAARQIEPELVARGIPVITNASPYRLHPEVPLVVAEVNPGHLDLVRARPPGQGFLLANPNCSTTGLVLALAPLERAFGLEEVRVTTLQAASGAGYPGVPSLDLLGNVLPGIPGEEEKLETEPRKIFGRLEGGRIRERAIPIAADTHRVPVVDGHLLSLEFRLASKVSLADVRKTLERFEPAADLARLPSAPRRTLAYLEGPHRPQPRLDASRSQGMSVTLGRLRPSPLGGFRMTALVHNAERGAAGGTLLLAELALARGLLAAPSSAREHVLAGDAGSAP